MALFGRKDYAALMGRIARATLVASSFVGSWLLEQGGATMTTAVLGSAAVVNILLVVALIPSVRILQA